MQVFPVTGEVLDLSESTLILPVVSTGNVAQLAVDLLISTFSLRRVAVLSSEHLVPAVGGRDDEAGITTPLELYGKDDTKIYVVQQRSPVMKSHKSAFIDDIIAFAQQSRFSAVLILSGVDLSDRPEAHMQAPTFYLIPTTLKSISPQPTALEALVTHFPPFITTTSEELPLIPGSGLTTRLISSLPSTFPLTGVILEYVLEGDNRTDALLLASAVAKCLQKDLGITGDEPWKEPASWKQGLFGSAHDNSLFG